MAVRQSAKQLSDSGRAELSHAVSASRPALAAAFLFSAFVNLLMLTAPLYMLQVYDRVLVSRSVETLLALSMLVAFLFAVMGVLDLARSRIMARVGARLVDALDARVLLASFQRLHQAPQDIPARLAQRDLDTVARYWASPAVPAMFDAPWTPLFVAALFLFHPLLGWFALGGGFVLVCFTWANQRQSRAYLQAAAQATLAADRQVEGLKTDAELVRVLGMSGAALARRRKLRDGARETALATADRTGGWSVLSRTFRLFLQSAMLGLAAWLVLREELSAGAMVAASVLMGRALQPVEQIVGQWPFIAEANLARSRLAGLLERMPRLAERTPLPRPRARVEVQGLSVALAGHATPVLRGVSFTLEPGQAMAVIGPSGAGKSTLARALVGGLSPQAGKIRLDGATLDQFEPDALGALIGYLPQRVRLFDGTIAQNIARLDPEADPARVIAAARAAAAHDMILRLPEGYDTQVFADDAPLSGGQVQRIGLARALYGDPVLLVLDEPNSSLDNDGAEALNLAVRAARAAGSAVLIMAHRPAALRECDLLLVLKDGAVAALGPRDEVLRGSVQNLGEIARVVASGGRA
jgi:ATP-binding cassette, subfamily C, bacterial